MVWLICFCFGTCGWTLGIISFLSVILSLIFLNLIPVVNHCKVVPFELGSNSISIDIDNTGKKDKHNKPDYRVTRNTTFLPSTITVKERSQFVFSSIFAPAEIKRKSHMLVQIYLHLSEETEQVKSHAKESSKEAKRRDYIPLQCKMNIGDKVEVDLTILGEKVLMSGKKTLVWQGSFTKCSFDYYVPKDIEIDALSCVAILTVNGIQVGEMRFITQIVERPLYLYSDVKTRQYKKIFISYAHQDESKVKYIASAYRAQGVDYFFDRQYLKPGDIFPLEIQEYIDTADLFILCWSKNASKSEYVKLEMKQALKRAYPNVHPAYSAKLSIYPLSIKPHAKLPDDMKDYYHFGKI